MEDYVDPALVYQVCRNLFRFHKGLQWWADFDGDFRKHTQTLMMEYRIVHTYRSGRRFGQDAVLVTIALM